MHPFWPPPSPSPLFPMSLVQLFHVPVRHLLPCSCLLFPEVTVLHFVSWQVKCDSLLKYRPGDDTSNLWDQRRTCRNGPLLLRYMWHLTSEPDGKRATYTGIKTACVEGCAHFLPLNKISHFYPSISYSWKFLRLKYSKASCLASALLFWACYPEIMVFVSLFVSCLIEKRIKLTFNCACTERVVCLVPVCVRLPGGCCGKTEV